MADHAVETAFHGTLSATTVDAVTLTRDHPNAEVKNRGDVAIYATVNGSVPTVGGADTFVVPAGESIVLVLSTRPGVPDVVRLIASDSCAYSVTGVSRGFERSGSTASSGGGGGGGAVTVADGADVALGTTTDAAATGNGTVVGILKRLRTLLNGGLPAALGSGGGVKVDGSGTALPVSGTVAVTGVATEATLDARTGALTETAPATDTASSGINGRLQRIAQRLTSLIGLLPTSLAAGGGLKVEGVSGGVAQPVTFPTYTAPVSGELAGSASALQLPNVACKMVMFMAEAANAGKVYLGVSGVTKIDGTTDTTTGFQLAAGQATPWIPVDNLNRLFRICDNAGDDLTYLVMN